MAFSATLHAVHENGSGDLVVQGSTTSAMIDGGQVSFDGGQTFQQYFYLGQDEHWKTGETGEFFEINGMMYAYSSDAPEGGLKTGNWKISEDDLDYSAPPCFVAGTLIRTPGGDVPIEELEVGDYVITYSGRIAPILWLGYSKVTASMQQRDPSLRAVNIGPGAVGNKKCLTVSQQHRILIQGYKAELWFGEPEILVPAKALLHSDAAYLSQSDVEIRYHHLLLDSHDIVFANGVPSETLFFGEQLNHRHKKEIEMLFPDLCFKTGLNGAAAKPILHVTEAKVLFG